MQRETSDHPNPLERGQTLAELTVVLSVITLIALVAFQDLGNMAVSLLERVVEIVT